MNTPSLIAALEIAMLKKKATDLYDIIDSRLAQMKDECGASRFDYDLNDLPERDGILDDVIAFGESLLENGQYFKLEIVDNLQKLNEDGSCWKSVAFKSISFSVRSLKGRPKALKE